MSPKIWLACQAYLLPPEFSGSYHLKFSYPPLMNNNFLNITPFIIYLTPFKSPFRGEFISVFYVLKFEVLVKL